MRTLPAETLSHLGWVESIDRQMERRSDIARQIDALLDGAVKSGVRRMWVVIRPGGKFPWENAAPTFADLITQTLFERAESHGWREGADCRRMSNVVRIAWLER